MWLPPYQIVLAAFGLLLGLIPGLPHPRLQAGLILAIFVPALVFEAALNLNLDALRAVTRPVALLATAGVLATIAAVAAVAHLVLRLDWPGALLLGAILSPTDPIAVVAVVRGSAAPAKLAALLEGESLFNDGTGVAAFAAILAVIASGTISVPRIAFGFLFLTAIGAATGAAIGLAGSAVVRRTRSTLLELLVTILVAYGSYAAASALGASGVMAVVVAGVAMAQGGNWGARTETWWARLATVLSVVLFTLIGVGLPSAAVFAQIGAVGLGFLVLSASRLLLVHLPGLGVPPAWRQLLWWGGVRGALSVVLALAAAGQPGVNPSVPAIAYGVVMLSLLLQGTAVRPAVRLLGLDEESGRN